MPQEENEFALTETQRARLLTCRAAWSEGEDEEYLQRLRQKSADEDYPPRHKASIIGGNRFCAGRTAELRAMRPPARAGSLVRV